MNLEDFPLPYKILNWYLIFILRRVKLSQNKPLTKGKYVRIHRSRELPCGERQTCIRIGMAF